MARGEPLTVAGYLSYHAFMDAPSRLSEELTMQALLRHLILATAVAGTAGRGCCRHVQVSLNHPERFTDARDAPGPYPTASLQEITAYLQRLGQKYLPEGQTLSHRAAGPGPVGKLQPSRHTTQRLGTGLPAARWTGRDAKLRYTLQANGQVIKSGEESVSGHGLLPGHIGVYGSDPLRYGKAHAQ